ncbi:MAG: sigma-54 dependent transcriptional regulator [bacterium]|nr:sigma-54 dependent transcriptional regulator [bacterium]
MAKGKVLIVDDEPNMQHILDTVLKMQGYEVRTAGDGLTALQMMKTDPADIIISDIRMPKLDGMELLKEIKRNYPDSEVIMITAYGTVETAVQAMKLGAYDYILKPWDTNDEIILRVAKARERQELKIRNWYLTQEIEQKYDFDNLVGSTPVMQKIFELIKKVATTDSTVLITGESGTGKEVIAKAIHYHSLRKDKPFVSLNCGGIPEHLLESELFGHEKGSFTGAISQKKGLIESAEGGTFFLDEVAELPLSLQVKFLRVLQDKEFKRVGGLENLRADVRLIAATNKDLQEAVRQKMFREDLFFRLNVIPIHLPPLRERKEDIPKLIDRCLTRLSKKSKRKKELVITPAAMQLLINYSWPGNIRELENIIEQLFTLSDSEKILPTDLPAQIIAAKTPEMVSEVESLIQQKTYQEAKTVFERHYFNSLLTRYQWNITAAAKAADMSRRNLYQKIRDLNLVPPWEKKESIN